MPSNSSRRLDETMATEMENLSLSSLDSMRNVMELLSDMLQAVNPSDRMAIKDEVIVDLVNRCRANQKKLMQMLTTTGDEELLARGLDLNDGLQSLLAKHDAIVSGLPVPTQATNVSPQPTEKSLSSSKHTEVKDSSASDSSPKPNTNLSATVGTMTKVQIYEDEEEEDEFAQLARRHIKPRAIPPQNTSSGSDDGLALVSTSSTINPSSTTATSVPSNALALPDPPAQVKTTKEQDMIDLLSITLSTTAASPDTTPHAPASNPQAAPSNGNMHQVPVSPSVQGNPYPSQPYPGNLGMASQNSYVVPWAQPQPQLQQQFRPQLQPQTQPQFQSQFQPQTQPQFHSQFQPQYSSGYPPPPWAATPGYSNNQNHLSANNMFSTPRANATTSYMPAQGARPLQHFNSFPARGINGSDNNGGFPVIPGPRSPAPAAGQKPFVPSYRLFEDLNVFGNADGKFKITNSNTSSSLSGTAGQGMVGGRK
ncbi:PREDICTED: TOM1 [Prunus dulcis]|nr:PREDICTED: TOM1 [Prunus dulcis]